MPVFVLTQVNGPSYDPSRPRREQAGWTEHAAYMDKLLADGFVIMGGPLDDGQQVMLIVEAADEQDVADKLAADPWRPMGILATKTLQRWDVWLDSRTATG
ncbi:MAG TPA: YciI family protein [Streptosporangiaceae bacterium]|nr:YciI family protein [Streptosporangiaceae bacterium]